MRFHRDAGYESLRLPPVMKQFLFIARHKQSVAGARSIFKNSLAGSWPEAGLAELVLAPPWWPLKEYEIKRKVQKL